MVKQVQATTFAAMEKTRLEAHYENRVYYFTVTNKSAEKLVINMYSTEYIFVAKEGQGWINALSNKNEMVPGLIAAVALASGVALN